MKRSLLVEQHSGFSVVVDGGNRHDTRLLEAALAVIVVAQSQPEVSEQHLWLDKTYDNPTGYGAVQAYDYHGHIRRIGREARSTEKGRPKASTPSVSARFVNIFCSWPITWSEFRRAEPNSDASAMSVIVSVR